MSLFFKFFVCERVLSKEEWGRFALFAKNWLHRWLRSKPQVGKGFAPYSEYILNAVWVLASKAGGSPELGASLLWDDGAGLTPR